jgi:murein DD-endopeptidase MepM/ murein hydrolase activator NlpD
MRAVRWIGVLILAAACSDSTPPTAETCEGYSDWATSSYVLPFPAGKSFAVIQGNCAATGNGHRGANKYSYDFGMPIGSEVSAARAGTVVALEESHLDGQVAASGFDNYVVIAHDDGSAALYGHLTHDGALVAVGDKVVQSQPIGRSGNTGNTANMPHLHFSLQACDPVAGGSTACPTKPSTFRNTSANPGGLVSGQSYTALP